MLIKLEVFNIKAGGTSYPELLRAWTSIPLPNFVLLTLIWTMLHVFCTIFLYHVKEAWAWYTIERSWCKHHVTNLANNSDLVFLSTLFLPFLTALSRIFILKNCKIKCSIWKKNFFWSLKAWEIPIFSKCSKCTLGQPNYPHLRELHHWYRLVRLLVGSHLLVKNPGCRPWKGSEQSMDTCSCHLPAAPDPACATANVKNLFAVGKPSIYHAPSPLGHPTSSLFIRWIALSNVWTT